MESTKQAALMICLQQAQVDNAAAKQENEELTKRAVEAEAKVAQLRAIISNSGSENMRMIVNLQAENQRMSNVIEIQNEAIDRMDDDNYVMRGELNNLREEHNQLRSDSRALCDAYDKLQEKYDKLREKYPQLLELAQRIEADRNEHRGRWVQELQRRVDAERSDRRNKRYLERARKSRNKAQRRLYTLRKRALQLQAANN